ncbi:uncharacterized protein METZ01_LOCUS497681, partial [marine metagenome]
KNLSRITKINKNSGEIIWHVGRRWLGENNIIEPAEQTDRFSGQHGLQLLNNGNLVIFDNGISSGINDGTNIQKSRAMELKVSDILEVVWSYTLPVDLYGVISGNAQKLSNGNYFITTVGSSDGAHSLEVNNSGEIVWDCKYNVGTPQGAIYRAMRTAGLYKTDSPLSMQNFNLPQLSQLKSIYPNPFNPIINIEYELSEPTAVQFGIYNIKGEEIDRINVGYKQPGFYTTVWNGE